MYKEVFCERKCSETVKKIVEKYFRKSSFFCKDVGSKKELIYS